MNKIKFNQNWIMQYNEGGTIPIEVQQQENGVTIPHDASVQLSRNPNEPHGSGNGYFREGNYTYTKELIVDSSYQNKSVWLEFEGIYQNAYVYINNTFAGKCAYGYSNFYVDITNYLQQGKNTIKVVVKNAVHSGRWYTGGGIYRDVNLMIADRLHILPDTVHISTQDVSDGIAAIRVNSELEYSGIGVRDIRLIQELYDAAGKLAARDDIPVTIEEHTKHSCQQRLYIENPVLWDAEHPYLYQYHSIVMENGEIIDEERGSFGIRTLQLDPKYGLRVNGKSVKLRGGCIHHDNGIIGAAEFPHAAEVRIRELKKAGYNAIRSTHYPMSRQLLSACDKLGMYVMDEYTDVWVSTKVDFDYGMHMMDCWEQDLENLVKKDYNHPCVLMYSIGNEIPEVGNRFGVQWGRKLVGKLRHLDDSRYITNGINMLMSTLDRFDIICEHLAQEDAALAQSKGEKVEINSLMAQIGEDLDRIMECDLATQWTEESFSHIDIAGYNYAPGRYEADGVTYPNRVIVGTESYPKALDKIWELVEKLPYVIGDFAWTAWDYLGETGIGLIRYGVKVGIPFYADYPAKAAYCGDFNLIGDRRPVSYWREIIWGLRKKPYLAVQPPQHHGELKGMTDWAMTDAVRSWTWSGCEGKNVTVEVYTLAEEAALYVNNTLVEKKTVGTEKKGMVTFETVYAPGTLEVITYREGQEDGRDTLITAESETCLFAVSDKKEIPSDGSDICYVDLFIKDHNGNLNFEVIDPITVNIEGPGNILGYGSADPSSEENYFDRTAVPFEGRLRAAVRGSGEKGTITVRFERGDGEKTAVRIETI